MRQPALLGSILFLANDIKFLRNRGGGMDYLTLPVSYVHVWEHVLLSFCRGVGRWDV